MTDDWTPDNVPIMLQSRSLLTATRSKAFQIGRARATAQDEDAMLALDQSYEMRADRQVDAESQEDGWTLQGRREGEADWLQELTGMPYQVTYYFPSKLRNNRVGPGKYGSGNMTFRVLYEALCEAFNAGRLFIEDYFFSAFEDNMKDRYEAAVRTLKQQIVDEAQKRRRLHRAYLSTYNSWVSPMTKNTFETLARETKADIIACLASGRIPLAKNGLSERTLAARRRLGIGSEAVFYATGRLISAIVVSVILLDGTTASQQQGVV